MTYETLLVISPIVGTVVAYFSGARMATWFAAGALALSALAWWVIAEWVHGGTHPALQAYAIVTMATAYFFYRERYAQVYAVYVIAASVTMCFAAIDVTITTNEIPAILWVLAVSTLPGSYIAWVSPTALVKFMPATPIFFNSNRL